MTFIPNPDFEREFKAELSVKAAMLERAQVVKGVVEQIAPEGYTGDYADLIVAGEDEEGAYVASTDFAGHIVEFGSVNNEAYAPLRRGVISAGLSFSPLPKH